MNLVLDNLELTESGHQVLLNPLSCTTCHSENPPRVTIHGLQCECGEAIERALSILARIEGAE